MRAVGVDFQLLQHRVAERPLRQHALHRPLQDPAGKPRVQLGIVDLADSTREIGVAVVFLVEGLAPGHAQFRRVQHDDEIAGVDVGREFRLVLAAQARRNLRREAPEYLVLRVDDVPAVDYIVCLGGESFHPAADREKARMLPKKRRNLLRLRRIHRLEEGGVDEVMMPYGMLQCNRFKRS